MTQTPTKEQFERFEREVQEQIDGLVAKGNWLVISVGGEDASMPAPKPAFSYTIGLTEHGLPELALAGLNPVESSTGSAGRLMRDSGSFREGQIINNALSDGMPVGFANVPPDSLAIASRRYGASGYTALQVFWPDTLKRLPWQQGVDAQIASIQHRLWRLGMSAPIYKPH